MGWVDKMKNKTDEAKGAAKKQLGKATDDEQMEREGQIDQTKSNLKQAQFGQRPHVGNRYRDGVIDVRQAAVKRLDV